MVGLLTCSFHRLETGGLLGIGCDAHLDGVLDNDFRFEVLRHGRLPARLRSRRNFDGTTSGVDEGQKRFVEIIVVEIRRIGFARATHIDQVRRQAAYRGTPILDRENVFGYRLVASLSLQRHPVQTS